MESSQLKPKVFISYSHTPQEHAERVYEIAQRLANDGIEVEMDLWSVKEGHDLNAFMERMVTDGSLMKVLVFSNRSYAEKADSRRQGVGVEAQILSSEIYGKVQQDKFIPIVCERDESGKAFLPTFFASHLYIDFSDSDKEEQNYERLVRRICDKPEHTKPTVGELPSYITEETVPSNPFLSKLRTYREALRAGKTNTRYRLEDCLDAFAEVLEKHRLSSVGDADDPNADHLEKTLEPLKSLRDQFLDLCHEWLRGPDAPIFGSRVVPLLEKFLLFAEWNNASNLYNYSELEAHKIFAHEVFLSLIGMLLRLGEFNFVAEIMAARFVVPSTPRSPERHGSFGLFYTYSETFERKNRIGRATAHSNFLNNRAARMAPFKWLQQADLICSVSSLLFPGNDDFWYPHTLAEARLFCTEFELFSRAESRRFYKQLAEIWNGISADEFRETVPDGLAQHIQGAWARWLNVEKLATTP